MDSAGKMHAAAIPATMYFEGVNTLADRIARRLHRNEEFCFIVAASRNTAIDRGRKELSAVALDLPVLRGLKKLWITTRRN
jgi:hypothetical protein